MAYSNYCRKCGWCGGDSDEPIPHTCSPGGGAGGTSCNGIGGAGHTTKVPEGFYKKYTN